MKYSKNGFTLLEVLIAIVVFSFGLLGIAGMMTISVKNNHNGYLRSQANFLAENMLDRMRANPTALWQGDYDGTATSGSADCSLSNLCNYQQLAVYDMQKWAESVEISLPNGVGAILCNNTATLPTNLPTAKPPSIWVPAPIYKGVCTITITWDESNRDSNAEQQTMVMVAQP